MTKPTNTAAIEHGTGIEWPLGWSTWKRGAEGN